MRDPMKHRRLGRSQFRMRRMEETGGPAWMAGAPLIVVGRKLHRMSRRSYGRAGSRYRRQYRFDPNLGAIHEGTRLAVQRGMDRGIYLPSDRHSKTMRALECCELFAAFVQEHDRDLFDNAMSYTHIEMGARAMARG